MHRDRIPHFSEKACRFIGGLGVEAVYLFGSRAMGRAGPLSDYDYGILHQERGHQRGDTLYDHLYDLLGKISPRSLENDVIDIVFLRDAGLELRFHVVRYGEILFDGHPRKRLQFESETTILYCDYRPLLTRFDDTILQSL